MITKQTQLNIVIGHPLLHTKSPFLHNFMYSQLGLNAVMLPVSNVNIGKLISAIRIMSINLTAVTMPFKESAMPLLDSIDSNALKIGAVNTIINRNGKLTGYNTDLFGIEYALRHTTLRNKNVLLIGAGGAASAVAYMIKNKGGRLIYVNRTPGRTKNLQKRFGGKISQMNKISAEDVDVIINATPLGMYPNFKNSPVPDTLIGKNQTIFDLVYNPVKTSLIKTAEKKGATAISGIDMFIAQGVRQAELWTRKKIITPKLVGLLKKKIIKEKL
jgi:shikimate dehydrogenase